jgi:hypothetical protein
MIILAFLAVYHPAQFRRIIPVIKDTSLGADCVPSHFADSEWHFTEAAAAIRSDSLARQLQENAFCSQAELDDLAAQR